MKKFSLRLLSVVAIFAVLFSSCTKDSLSKPSSQVSKHSPNDPGPTVLTGSIHAILSSASALRTSIVVTDDNGFKSDEMFADQNGEVTVTDLPEGTYTVTAHAYIPEGHDDQPTDVITDLTITITDVVVVGDQITDLGKIIFGQ
jgi:hypothetical protein